ncbi:MAG: ADP-ribosylglycohydrolase family protein, partial [bacterium]
NHFYKKTVFKKILNLAFIFFLFTGIGSAQDAFTISKEELKDKIAGYWYGQLVGNYMGFSFEFMYMDKPVPVFVDRYYNATEDTDLRIHNDRRGYTHIMASALDGAYTDDDTDIEFVTLHAVEKYGLDITYPEITEAWKTHINRFIWGSNHQARILMNKGFIAPETGSKEHNPYWFHIDPQLVNEIWSVFYPGMVEKAVERAEWGAHITNDDWGTHPTMFYAAIYSAAFYEKDISIIYEIGMSHLPESSPFLPALKDLKKWYNQNDDWRNTWKLIREKYYKYPVDTEGHNNNVNAIINGLFGAMAILYGEGDFVKTTGIAISAGFDCDNQAATCAGFIGILNGAGSIPKHLTTELSPFTAWEEPFNNLYINYSRDELPNATPITEIIDRIYVIAEKAILNNGGEKIIENEKTILNILIQ